jgi:hypothetical protein
MNKNNTLTPFWYEDIAQANNIYKTDERHVRNPSDFEIGDFVFQDVWQKRFHYTGHFSNQMLQIYIFVLNMTLLFEYFFTFTNCLMQT